MKIIPNLHYKGLCFEALKLYEKAFNAEITVLLQFRDAKDEDFNKSGLSEKELNYVYHAEMNIYGQRFMFNDNTEEFSKGENVSIVLVFSKTEEVTQAYNMLKEDAVIRQPLVSTSYSGCFTSLIDKFGIRWELMTER